MDRYKQNAKWLMWLAPFSALSLSAAYLAPFFLQKGLNLSQILLLQSVFSLAFLLWEIPSGWLADRFGRAFSIKMSVPIAAVSMVFYGLSSEIWQFILCELALAFANGFMSGVNTALLLDSLKADGREHEYVRLAQRIDGLGWLATAIGVPVAMALVHFWGVSSTIIADGLLSGVGVFFAWKLVEAPRFNGSQEAVRLSAWHAVKQLGRNIEARWLVTLGVALSTATYLAFWLSAPYYSAMGVPVVWFGALLAIRSLWKAWLSHHFHAGRHQERKLLAYAGLAGLVYVAMATQQLWLVWAVLGHDVVQALAGQPVTAQLNKHMYHEFRATTNSLVNLCRRLVYAVAGPAVGFLADKAGLPTAFVVSGAVFSAVALLALSRLRAHRTFAEA